MATTGQKTSNNNNLNDDGILANIRMLLMQHELGNGNGHDNDDEQFVDKQVYLEAIYEILQKRIKNKSRVRR